MENTSFIVIETKNGKATPSSVWIADGEKDYCNKVSASNPRSGEDFSDFETVRRSDQERHAMTVQIMTKSDFLEYDSSDLDSRILDAAERLDWYTPPTSTSDDE